MKYLLIYKNVNSGDIHQEFFETKKAMDIYIKAYVGWRNYKIEHIYEIKEVK